MDMFNKEKLIELAETRESERELNKEINVREIRKKINATQELFSRIYNIPKRTIENWENGSRKCPEYVLNLLDRAVNEDVKQLNQKQNN